MLPDDYSTDRYGNVILDKDLVLKCSELDKLGNLRLSGLKFLELTSPVGPKYYHCTTVKFAALGKKIQFVLTDFVHSMFLFDDGLLHVGRIRAVPSDFLITYKVTERIER